MSSTHERTSQLIAAAVAQDLTTAEQDELRSLCAEDPTILEEIERLRTTARRLDSLAGWVEAEPSAALREKVTGAPAGTVTALPGQARPGVPPRRRAALAVAAAALVAVGAGGAIGVQQLVQDETPTGPPGTLGAFEPVAFAPDRDPADVDARLVAHTWGTEAVLAVDGLPAGESYRVVFVDEQGEEVDAGAFLGSDVTITCRLNAAVMREQVVGLRIQDSDGSVVRTADLPVVRG